jgi:hypothetical protein
MLSLIKFFSDFPDATRSLRLPQKLKAIGVAWFCEWGFLIALRESLNIADQLEVGLRNLVYNALVVADFDPLVLESSMKVRQTSHGINRDQIRFQIYI